MPEVKTQTSSMSGQDANHYTNLSFKNDGKIA